MKMCRSTIYWRRYRSSEGHLFSVLVMESSGGVFRFVRAFAPFLNSCISFPSFLSLVLAYYLHAATHDISYNQSHVVSECFHNAVGKPQIKQTGGMLRGDNYPVTMR